MRLSILSAFTLVALISTGIRSSGAEKVVDAGLLIVGGGESGCAAAIQAARMGVKRIVLVAATRLSHSARFKSAKRPFERKVFTSYSVSVCDARIALLVPESNTFRGI